MLAKITPCQSNIHWKVYNSKIKPSVCVLPCIYRERTQRLTEQACVCIECKQSPKMYVTKCTKNVFVCSRFSVCKILCLQHLQYRMQPYSTVCSSVRRYTPFAKNTRIHRKNYTRPSPGSKCDCAVTVALGSFLHIPCILKLLRYGNGVVLLRSVKQD